LRLLDLQQTVSHVKLHYTIKKSHVKHNVSLVRHSRGGAYMKKKISLDELVIEVKKKRGSTGIRETATDIGISPATLSRVENGKLPDIDTFTRICRWLDVDAGEILNCSKNKGKIESSQPALSVHLKADKNLSKEAAHALADMIISTQQMLSS
jgi:transcriptional regulator with XRE-family HTH domain